MEHLKKLFNKEFSKIGEAAIVLAFFTLLSQLLGIFRDRFLAGNIGTGELLDVYYAAFRIPDLVFTLAASLVSVSILMPYFRSELLKSKKGAQKFINDTFTVFFSFIIFLSLVLFFLMPLLIQKLFPGFNQVALNQTVLLSRIMLFSPILLGISNLFATITQTFKQFFVYALSPIFYNLGIIVGILILYPYFGFAGLAYGVVLGSFLHMLIQLPVIVKHGFFPVLQFSIKWSSLLEILKHSLPRTFTLSIPKIVFLFFISLASTLGSGTISVFNLSYNLQSVPLAIIGVSYSLAAFPVLVEFFTNKEMEKFKSHVVGPMRQIIFWSLPVVTLFIVLRAQIVRVILGTGNFDWSDTRLTAASLALFVISVVAQSITILLIRAYYAAGKTWKPLFLNIFSAGCTIFFAYMFVYIYQHYSFIQDFFEALLRIKNVPGSAVIMLSLAYSVGMFLSLLFLWVSFKKDFQVNMRVFGIGKTILQSLLASLVMGVVAYLLLQITRHIFSTETTLGVFAHGFVSGIGAIMVGGGYLLFIKNEEIILFINTLGKKILKQNLIR